MQQRSEWRQLILSLLTINQSMTGPSHALALLGMNGQQMLQILLTVLGSEGSNCKQLNRLMRKTTLIIITSVFSPHVYQFLCMRHKSRQQRSFCSAAAV